MASVAYRKALIFSGSEINITPQHIANQNWLVIVFAQTSLLGAAMMARNAATYRYEAKASQFSTIHAVSN
jgi:hypothetical protein